MRDELAHHEAPAIVRAWIAHAPAWLDVQPDHAAGTSDDRTVPTLDRGERAVIALARAVRADLVRMDDRDGVQLRASKVSPQQARWACSISRPGAGWSISPQFSNA